MKLALYPDDTTKTIEIIGKIAEDEITPHSLRDGRPDIARRIEDEVVKQVSELYVSRYAAAIIARLDQQAIANLSLASIAAEVARLVGHKR